MRLFTMFSDPPNRTLVIVFQHGAMWNSDRPQQLAEFQNDNLALTGHIHTVNWPINSKSGRGQRCPTEFN